MRRSGDRPRSVPPPAESMIVNRFQSANLADAYAIPLPSDATRDIGLLSRAVLGHPANWVRILLATRDVIVAGFGVKTSRRIRADLVTTAAERIDFFRIRSSSNREVVVGEDDRHLDFRTSVLLRPQSGGEGNELVVATVVHCHNLLGRSYLALISPFHRTIVRSMLRRAAQRGWPRRAQDNPADLEAGESSKSLDGPDSGSAARSSPL